MNRIIYKSIERHNKDVLELQKNILNRKKIVTFSNKTSNTLRNEYKQNSLHLDISSLDQIIYMDFDEEKVLVEPSISFSSLCEQTLKQGWIVPVVPEFKGITVGGAIMGGSLESSSHFFGQVSDTCLEYECLLGNGEVVTATPSENSDLFFGLSCSYGSLALLTLVKMRLIKAKKYVRLTYHQFTHLQEGLSFLNQSDHCDFKESIGFSLNNLIVSKGYMQDRASSSFISMRPWTPWYANRVENSSRGEETMSVKDYLFRYDAGAFWMGNYIVSLNAIKHIFFGTQHKMKKESLIKKNPSFFFRLFFGWAFASKKLYKLWHHIPKRFSENMFFIHDFYAPKEKVYDVLQNFLDKTQIFPFWLCPVAKTMTPQFLSPHFGGKDFVNIGLYGRPISSKSILELSKEMEKEILTFGGRKMLYSLTYYDLDFFSKAYDLKRYDLLRKKFYADDAFPHLYHKITNKQPIQLTE